MILPASPLSSHLLDTVQVWIARCTSGRSAYTYRAQVHPTTSLSSVLNGKKKKKKPWSNSWFVGRTKCWHYIGLNSIQSVVSTCYGRKSVGFWTYWFLLVKSRFYAGCTTKKKGHLNRRNLPDGANCLQAQRPDGRIRWQPGMVNGSRLAATIKM